MEGWGTGGAIVTAIPGGAINVWGSLGTHPSSPKWLRWKPRFRSVSRRVCEKDPESHLWPGIFPPLSRAGCPWRGWPPASADSGSRAVQAEPRWPRNQPQRLALQDPAGRGGPCGFCLSSARSADSFCCHSGFGNSPRTSPASWGRGWGPLSTRRAKMPAGPPLTSL